MKHNHSVNVPNPNKVHTPYYTENHGILNNEGAIGCKKSLKALSEQKAKINNNNYIKQRLTQEYHVCEAFENANDTLEFSNVDARLNNFRNCRFLHIHASNLLKGKYLPHDLIIEEAYKQQCAVVVLAVGMGAGKTEQFKHAKNDYFNGIGAMLSHRVALVKSTAERIGAADYEDIKAYKSGDLYHESAVSAFACTIHSLPTLVRLEEAKLALQNGLLGIDESESVAAEFLQSTIKNEPLTLNSLRHAALNAEMVMLMDAHAGAGTYALLKSIGYQDKDILLVTADVKEFAGYQVRMYEEKPLESVVKTAIYSQIIKDLTDGKKVIVTSLSKTALDEIERLIKQKLPTIAYIKVTSDTSKSEESQALNAKTYKNYQLVMLSPSMSTGISFDKDNAGTAYCIAVNAADTGTAYDALQAMLRDRAVKAKVINIYYQGSDSTLSTTQKEHLFWDAQSRKMQAIIEEYPEVKARIDAIMPDTTDAFVFMRAVAVEQARAKQNFLQILADELAAKGASVSVCDYTELDQDEVSDDDRREVKEQGAKERIDAIINAPTATHADVELLKSSHAQGSVAKERERVIERLKLVDDKAISATIDRHRIETETTTTLETLPQDDREAIIKQVVDGGLLKKLYLYDLAKSDEKDLKRVQKAAVSGVQADAEDEVGFVEKLSSSRKWWPELGRYSAALLKSIGVTVEDGLFVWDGDDLLTDERIKNPRDRGHTAYQILANRAKEFIECGLLPITTIPLNVKKNPAKHIREALDGLGIKLVKARKAERYTTDAEQLSRILTMTNNRANADKNIVLERIARIDEYLANAEARKERLKTDYENYRVIDKKLATTPKPSDLDLMKKQVKMFKKQAEVFEVKRKKQSQVEAIESRRKANIKEANEKLKQAIERTNNNSFKNNKLE